MEINIVIDKECELKMQTAANKLEDYCKKNNIKSHKKDIIVIFSNNHNFIKEFAVKTPKNSVIINVTENLSEQHVINALKCVSDICYLKTDVNVIASRIICACNRTVRTR